MSFLLTGLAVGAGWLGSSLLRGRQQGGRKVAGSNVCVTGGSKGIGYALAAESVRRGARSVTIMARGAAALAKAADDLRKIAAEANLPQGDRCTVHLFQCDVTDQSSIEAAFRDFRRAVLTCDIFIPCAGIAISRTAEESTPAENQNIVQLNLLGVINTTREVIKGMMVRRSGAICVIGSQAGQVGVYGFSSYSASKFGLVGYTQALRSELAPYGVLVTIAFPSDVDTPGYRLENETKSDICKKISGTIDIVPPETVAQQTLNGIAAGNSRISFGLAGWVLNVATMGMEQPVDSVHSLAEFLLCGLFRLIAIILRWQWAAMVSSHQEIEDRLANARGSNAKTDGARASACSPCDENQVQRSNISTTTTTDQTTQTDGKSTNSKLTQATADTVDCAT